MSGQKEDPRKTSHNSIQRWHILLKFYTRQNTSNAMFLEVYNYRVAQNKPDYSTFPLSYENFNKITLVAHRQI